MRLGDNPETQPVKPCYELGAVPFVLANFSYLGISGALTWLLLTTVLEAGMVPVSLHQSSLPMAFSHSECISKCYPISLLNDQNRLFFFLLKYQSHIQRLKYAYTSPPQYQHSLSCNIPFLPPATCSSSEGRRRSCRKLEIQETSKLPKTRDNQL